MIPDHRIARYAHIIQSAGDLNKCLDIAPFTVLCNIAVKNNKCNIVVYNVFQFIKPTDIAVIDVRVR